MVYVLLYFKYVELQFVNLSVYVSKGILKSDVGHMICTKADNEQPAAKGI